MDTANRARWRLGVIAAVPLLVLGAVVGGRLMAAPSANDGSVDGHPAATQASQVAPQPTSSTASDNEPTAWTRPTTTDPSSFARAFALAVWTYDTEQPYDVWKEAIGEWANPLGDPASASVGQSMLPPPMAYERLRNQGAHGTAEITSVTVPDVTQALAARAPEGWHAFTVRGTQHITAAGREVDTDRQLTVAVVCVRMCWLWSVTPEVEQ